MKRQKVQAIIYREQKGKKEYLILHRKLHWVGWESLKETMEKRESFEETIRRGIKEEIGVAEIAIRKEMPVKIIMNKDEEIVYAYVIQIDHKEKIDITKEKEHDEFRWVTKEEALKLLTYENTKEILKRLT